MGKQTSEDLENLSWLFLAIAGGVIIITLLSSGLFGHKMWAEVNSVCEGNPKDISQSQVVSTAEKFLLDTTKEQPVIPIPADQTYKKVKEHEVVEASCPASTNYNGERYELTYIDAITNQTTTIVAPKEFVTFEKIGENEIPSVQVITIVTPMSKYYGSIKRNTFDDQKAEINKYVVRL